MKELSLSIYIVPAIALVLVIIFYYHFSKHVVNKPNYRKSIITMSILAFILNFIWEFTQGPLYKGYKYDWEHISFCMLASIADMLMVLILLFSFGLIYKNVYWIKSMDLNKVLLLVFVGFSGAILAEVFHTMRGDWSYTDAMPLLPVVEVGVSPVLQFMILPWLIYSISKHVVKE
ncbi:hypothetical protein V5097_09930 [Arenibacter palladensis]|uniref:hypothetical protein n=1 Tax=Arenibacter palladensis TaxID=237373 RepID=UPI002FD3E301